MVELYKPGCCHPERSEGSDWLFLIQVESVVRKLRTAVVYYFKKTLDS
jgi:hypothetical protein